jgi:hypothetical protein
MEKIMPDYKTIILIIGILVLVVILTRKAILKQKQELVNPVRPPKIKTLKKDEIDAADLQFEKQWKSLSYLLGLAALGNLYSAYLSGRSAYTTLSTVLWIDCGVSVIAAIVAVVLWRKKTKDLAYTYMGIIIVQVMFFLSTGKYLIAMVHIFPLLLAYLVIKPVWNSMK